jgi:hypothetical protein
VVIALLAFQMSSISRGMMLSQTTDVAHLKKRLQLNSAIQLASFKILSGDWENVKIIRKINNLPITIEIYNESGFFSLYDLSSQSLNDILETHNIPLEELERMVARGSDSSQRFNDFYELRQLETVSDEMIHELIPFLSIYHQSPINPLHSPPEVLMKISRVDQFRVGQLIETSDPAEARRLRNEIIDILNSQNIEISEDGSPYYRLKIEMGAELYKVFLKLDNRSQKLIVVNVLGPVKNLGTSG